MLNKTKPTKAQVIQNLQQKIKELEALSILNQSQAYNTINKMGLAVEGSACIVSIETLGGGVKIKPFAINDGLSLETIMALKKDIARSIDLTVNHPINKLKD